MSNARACGMITFHAPTTPSNATSSAGQCRNRGNSSAATQPVIVARPSVDDLDVPTAACQYPPHSAARAANEVCICREAASICATCQLDRIRGLADVLEAIKITWQGQRIHLFTSWVHVPLGVCLMLVLVWVLGLALDQAPFRFPPAVLAAFGLFGALLSLDWLSNRFPGAEIADPETGQGEVLPRKRQRFLDPVMRLLAPPCDFCLRNMSVMFTPSFILIPAREVISAKEIGLIAAWFTVSQFVAFVIPVLLSCGLDWLCKVQSRIRRHRQAAKWHAKRKKLLPMSQRNSMTSVRKCSNAGLHNPCHRGSTATIVGLEFERNIRGGQKLGLIASGLAGVAATLTAPVAHIRMHLTGDEIRHLDAVAIEQARQQGEPEVERIIGHSEASSFTPRSDVSYFSHERVDHTSHHHSRSSCTPTAHRSRSLTMEPLSPRDARYTTRRPRSAEPLRSRSAPLPINRTPLDSAPSILSVFTAQTTAKLDYRSPAACISQAAAPKPPALAVAVGLDLPTASIIRTARLTTPSQPGTRLGPELIVHNEASLSLVSRTPSLIHDVEMFQHGSEGPKTASSKGKDKQQRSPSRNPALNHAPDAIERLAGWMGDLITPSIYFFVLLLGIPLWFAADCALPLFLSANLLCFIAGITIVPAKVRRFLHPILSCSIGTVLLLWAFGAMKGLGIKETLALYSNGARYTVLWTPGYKGPAPGAGDVLFSTLDAGIVALAIPMYRYRVDLRENFVRMVSTLIPCVALSLFFWPWIAHLMGMDEVRSLAFAARFTSTPLAIELANNVGADKSIVVILVVITGIIFAVFKDQLFRLMRVSDDMTIGLTMGSVSGAIGTSALLSKPRQMAISSLSFILFGSLLLIATAIPLIVETVQSLAGPELLKHTTGA